MSLAECPEGRGKTGSGYASAIRLAMILTIVYFFMEIIAGVFSGSLALLSDALHMFRDILALFLSFWAIRIACRLPTIKKTFGYHRIEIFVALINGVLLVLMSIFIIREAIRRIYSPVPIEGGIMLLVALGGLLINLCVIWLLRGSSDLNIRSAYLHVMGDTLASIGVIVAAVWIFFTGQTIADPVISIFIGIVVFVSAIPVISESISILLQFTPKGVDIEELVADISSVEGVIDVHHIHLWSLCSSINVFDGHICTATRDYASMERIKKEIKVRLLKYNVRHSTLEFEGPSCAGDDLLVHLDDEEERAEDS